MAILPCDRISKSAARLHTRASYALHSPNQSEARSKEGSDHLDVQLVYRKLDTVSFEAPHFPVSRLLCATSTANSRKAEEVHNYSTDEGRPLGTGLQEQVPNHLRRLCPKGKVVNAEGKGLELPGQVTGKKRTAREPLVKCRNETLDDVQNRSRVTTAG